MKPLVMDTNRQARSRQLAMDAIIVAEARPWFVVAHCNRPLRMIVVRMPRRDGRFRARFKKGRVDHTHAINIRAAKYIGYRTCGAEDAARVEPAL